jgi:hypothetical protein
MSEAMKIRRRVLRYLGRLGHSPDQIHAKLARMNITGVREEPSSCPMTNYLQGAFHRSEATRAAIILVNPNHVAVRIHQGAEVDVALPQPFQKFVDRFDNDEDFAPDLDHNNAMNGGRGGRENDGYFDDQDGE